MRVWECERESASKSESGSESESDLGPRGVSLPLLQIHMRHRIHEMVLQSQIPHEIVDLFLTITN